MENFEEKACLCALNRIFGFEPRKALALIGHLGSARALFNLSEKELDQLTGPYSKYRGSICHRAKDDAAEELLRLEKAGISFCGWTEECYPHLLRECDDAPTGIYIRSASSPKDLWNSAECVSVVGTRDISPYGREWCTKIVQGLSHTSTRPCIVSGLALGTDIEAHRTALASGLPTIGVMATGPESIYPYRNRATAELMASTSGCALITDYPPGTAPLPIHFLRRNRIIAGLSKATVLVESKIKGGGMMTCRLAFSYNRDVYALPGRIDDVRSQGCNSLIRQKIAEPITSTEMLVESIGFTMNGQTGTLTDKERLAAAFGSRADSDTLKRLLIILELIRRNRGITTEDLATQSGLGYRLASDAVGRLEIEGFITTDLLQRCCINHKNM